MKFDIEVEMEDRWVPHFLGMLKAMETYGKIGSSRNIAIYADGDGDFHPKFKFNTVELPKPAHPVDEKDGDLFFDAG